MVPVSAGHSGSRLDLALVRLRHPAGIWYPARDRPQPPPHLGKGRAFGRALADAWVSHWILLKDPALPQPWAPIRSAAAPLLKNGRRNASPQCARPRGLGPHVPKRFIKPKQRTLSFTRESRVLGLQ